ncbi:flagellar filament capping protein FliD [Microbacterium sp. nov. GSS16]|uniref:flagellar filament capping protein FliD n=1 Tax=Microbacterium sp. nov. GSS16 TaxID=3019890 RepID=UPI002304F314|nr:flagellar filament capping protein FliD [Microbacterium sp. nov. GSS16]WCD92848.1 flagellar filament capping protein FliD [Microbacterium sp. nov. GSS16]
MALSLDGLVSGLNTTDLIKAMMDVHSIPKNLLKSKIADKGVVISNLQSLNASLQDLATKANTASVPGAMTAFTATSSANTVKVTAGADATPGAIDIVVDHAAQRHSVVSAPLAAWPDEPPVITLQNSKGERVEVTAASTSMQDVAKAINQAGFGVRATAVSAGTSADGTPLYRLQLNAAELGAGGTFTVLRGDVASVEAGNAADILADPRAATVSTGADAQVRLWAGTAAEQIVTSSNGTFTGLLPGVDVTVTATSTDPITVTVATDSAAQAKAHEAFVAQIAKMLSGIDKGSTATVPAGAGETTTLGVFTGDSTVRALRRGLADAVQYPVDGVSPSTMGISIDRYGVLSFDQERFTKALVENPEQVAATFSGLATRVEEVAKSYSDKHDGLLTARITGQQNEVDALGEQVERWDVRLAQRKTTLERTYAQLEVQLSRMQSQSSYLTSQLSALTPKQNGS